MKDFAPVKARYLRDPIPVRLGGLAADLARVGSAAANPANGQAVQVLLEEARRFIEWTAADLDVDVAGELMDLQLSLTLWVHVWEEGRARRHIAPCWLTRRCAGPTGYSRCQDCFNLRNHRGRIIVHEGLG